MSKIILNLRAVAAELVLCFTLLAPVSALAIDYELDLAGSPSNYRANLAKVTSNTSKTTPIPTTIIVREARLVNGEHPTLTLIADKYLGDGQTSSVFRVKYNGQDVALKVPKCWTGYDVEPRLTTALGEFEMSVAPVQNLKEWFTLRQMSKARTAEIIRVEPQHFIMMEYVSGPLLSEFITQYNPSIPAHVEMMDDLISFAKDLKFLSDVADLHSDNLMYGNGGWKIIDAGNPLRPGDLLRPATSVNSLTLLESLVGLEKPNTSLAQLKVDFATFYANASAAERLANGTIEIRNARTGMPGLDVPEIELPPGSNSCNIRSGTGPSGVAFSMGLLDMISIWQTAYEETYTAAGSSRLASWNGKPGAICSQIMPRLKTLWCERDWGITDVFFGGDFNCTYVKEVYPNQRQAYSSTPDVPSCTVVYAKLHTVLKTKQDYEFATLIEKGKSTLNIPDISSAINYLNASFSYQLKPLKDISGEIVYPPGGDIY